MFVARQTKMDLGEYCYLIYQNKPGSPYVFKKGVGYVLDAFPTNGNNFVVGITPQVFEPLFGFALESGEMADVSVKCVPKKIPIYPPESSMARA